MFCLNVAVRVIVNNISIIITSKLPNLSLSNQNTSLILRPFYVYDFSIPSSLSVSVYYKIRLSIYISKYKIFDNLYLIQ